MTIRFHFELAVEFAQSLAHSSKTNARLRARIPKPGQPLGCFGQAEVIRALRTCCKLVGVEGDSVAQAIERQPELLILFAGIVVDQLSGQPRMTPSHSGT
jgi:hypothetical protein